MDSGYISLTKCLKIIKIKLASDTSNTQLRLNPLSRLEMSLSPEIMKIDEAVELLGYGSREELVLCVIRRFLDRYHIPKIRAR